MKTPLQELKVENLKTIVKHNGSQHHAVGIIPDVLVEKTIEGVKQGKDEFLIKALELVHEEK